MAVAVTPNVLELGPVEIAQALLDQKVSVREQSVNHGGVVGGTHAAELYREYEKSGCCQKEEAVAVAAAAAR